MESQVKRSTTSVCVEAGRYYRVTDVGVLGVDGVAAGDLLRVESDDLDEEGLASLSANGRMNFEVDPGVLIRAVVPVEDPDAYVADRIHAEISNLNAMTADPAAVLGISPKELEVGTVGASDTVSLPAPGDSVDQGPSVLAMRNDPKDVKRRVSLARNHLLKFEKRLGAQQDRIKEWVEVQSGLLAGKIAKMDKVLKRAEEAVYTINLYLGRDEEIVRIAKGKPAPVGTQITVRQLTLYMDEECAVASEDGGIDHNSLTAFDEWLTSDPAHLQQVLPEEKGMVALRVRRDAKPRRGSGSNLAMAMALAASRTDPDQKTYFLIRNGKNLYRVWTTLEVGPIVYPRIDEYDHLFKDVTSRDGGVADDYRPGTQRYMKAMEAVDEGNREYMRVLLLMQGVIDRTAVFRPLPSERVNLFDQGRTDEHVRFIRDAEGLLTDGRPTFTEWLKDVNGGLTVGHRVVGNFTSAGTNLSSEENRRVRPAKAELPRNEDVFTIDRRASSHLVFLYDYIVKAYDWTSGRSVIRDSKRRASFTCRPSDTFLIDIDRASVDDMRAYLCDRVSRRSYVTMFPLLHRAIEFKEREAAEEAPFKALLVAECAKASGESLEEVCPQAVDELCLWWKLKNTQKRSLASNDKKAFRMIVDEYVRRRETARKSDGRAVLLDYAVSLFRQDDPNLLYVGLRPDGEVVTLSAHNRQDQFVRERRWKVKGRVSLSKLRIRLKPEAAVTAVCTSDRPWTVVDARLHGWRRLWDVGVRWASWPRDLKRVDLVSDDDVVAILAEARRRAEEDKTLFSRSRDSFPAVPLCMVSIRKGGYLYYLVSRATVPPAGRYLTGHWKSPDIEGKSVNIRRSAGGAPVVEFGWCGWTLSFATVKEEVSKSGLWTGEEGMAKAAAVFDAYREKRREYSRLKSLVGHYDLFVDRYLRDCRKDEVYKRYLDEHGDPELWEQEKGHLSREGAFRYAELNATQAVFNVLIQAGVDPAGMTLGEAFGEAKAKGLYKGKAEARGRTRFSPGNPFEVPPADWEAMEKGPLSLKLIAPESQPDPEPDLED